MPRPGSIKVYTNDNSLVLLKKVGDMKVGELTQVMDSMKDNSSAQISSDLNNAANNTFGMGSSIAAGKMGNILGRNVSANEAQETAQASIKFKDEHFNGDPKAASEFLQDANTKCPALANSDVSELVNSGAASQLKEMSDTNPEGYNQLLSDMNSNPELLAAIQNNPEQTIAAFKQEAPSQEQGEILVAQNDTGSTPNIPQKTPPSPENTPDTQSGSIADAGASTGKDNIIFGINSAAATNLLTQAWELFGDDGRLSPEMMHMGKDLIRDLVEKVYGGNSDFIGNAPEMAEKVAQTMGIDCNATHIAPDTGEEITEPEVNGAKIAEAENTPDLQNMPTLDMNA